MSQEPANPATPQASALLVTPAPWQSLRRFTDARIALGRAGHSIPTAAHLAFQWAHAQARDAVHLPFDAVGVQAAVQALGLEALLLHSAAPDRASYLQRPDWGRRLGEASRQSLAHWRERHDQRDHEPPVMAPPSRHFSPRLEKPFDADSDALARPSEGAFNLAFVVADGLSALAIHQHAIPLLSATLAHLHADTRHSWRVAPVAVVTQGRVAIGDEVGHLLRADAVVVLIGERPGLSSPDSLGLYLTWAPRPGLTDANRNCISNVRPAGLGVAAAALQLHGLLTQSRSLRLSGVALKVDTATVNIGPQGHRVL